MSTRKSTMTCRDITNKLIDQKLTDIQTILTGSPVIGCVKRLGKTADGSPKEDLYYYKPEVDLDQERRKRYSDVGKSARKCTMKDTQYFFRVNIKFYKVYVCIHVFIFITIFSKDSIKACSS